LLNRPLPKRLSDKGSVFGTATHIEAAEKVLVVYLGGISVGIGFQILKISFDHGPQVAHLGQQQVLLFDHAVDDFLK
jgi:hypothetical protein